MNTRDEAASILREAGLRVTAPRLAVLTTLASVAAPMSHSEVLAALGHSGWDPATIYRNLVKLREAGLAAVVNRANGIDRYALTTAREHAHRHPHFVCDDCGQVACLPVDVTPSVPEGSRWAASLEGAAIQLRGECPDCLESEDGGAS